jgi:hypothetical protein
VVAVALHLSETIREEPGQCQIRPRFKIDSL